MLRCHHCRGAATAGLMHLHGLPVHLCRTCAEPYLIANAAKALRKGHVLKQKFIRFAKAS